MPNLVDSDPSTVNVVCKDVRIMLITGQPISLAQSDKVLMTIQLPNDLLVTKELCIQIIQAAPMNQRCTLPLARC